MKRLLAVITMSVVLAGETAPAQTATNTLVSTTTNAPVTPATNAMPAFTKAADEKTWSYSLSAYTYVVPDDREYVQPTVTADRDRLHLEARYNYEALDTASAWVGYNFSGGEKLAWELTPMVGGVFGDTDGVAPGYKGTLGWWKLGLYTEGEYLFNTGNSSGNFFYSWSELTLTPVDWFRFGMVLQRTKLYQTEFDVQRGLLVGFTCKRVDFTAYIFDPGASQTTVVLSVGLGF